MRQQGRRTLERRQPVSDPEPARQAPASLALTVGTSLASDGGHLGSLPRVSFQRSSLIVPDTARVILYWLPLGAGGHSVRWNGRVFEAVFSRLEQRAVQDLYHSALEVHTGRNSYVIEMTPAWAGEAGDRGVVREGPVGLRWLGRFRLFRYEIRRWRDGAIPDVAEAVVGPREVSQDWGRAQHLLDLVPRVPALTWGRDESSAGEMWNSNSITSWLLARSGCDTGTLAPPAGGRAPGWSAGLVVAARERSEW